MASLVDIANMAILRVGSTPVADLDGNAPAQVACRIAWPFVRRRVLRAHSWNSATVRTSLARLTDAPAWDFDSQYTVPADCLHLMEVDTTYDWRVENGVLLTDGNGTIDVRYVKDETDTTKYDPGLTMVMVLGLAVEICEKLTGSRPKRELLLDEYLRALNDAMMEDGQEQSPTEFEEDDWILSRF